MRKISRNKNYTRLEKIEYWKARMMKAQLRVRELEAQTDEEHNQDWSTDINKDLAQKKIDQLQEQVEKLTVMMGKYLTRETN